MPVQLIPGRNILNAKHGHKCRCGELVILGQLKDAIGTIRWHNFESKPVPDGPCNSYRRHICAEPAKASSR
jgi:hypothetical protein